MINAILHDLRLCWKKLALTGVLYKIIAFALLTPVVAVLLQVFVSISGRTVLADEDILKFFVRPLVEAAMFFKAKPEKYVVNRNSPAKISQPLAGSLAP